MSDTAMLMSLGMFGFSIDSALFDQMRRRRSWRHPTNERVNARPAGQFAGPGDDMIELSGILAPGQIGRKDALEELAAMADTGQAWTLVDGEGFVYGAFVIEGLDEGKRNFMAGGIALQTDFSLQLRRMDDTEGEDAPAEATS
ncbi:MAG: phage tail protein [Brevundimonas sp.]|uniref:phage tail protein n=1 Tax=Brevundimonas sp. TaxID=1871086 RepID=UPI00274A7AB7|nr:phage tail protein [Brevundimonas sp.]MDP3400356.1 phage tail protein [Brevundimonas sp.]MDZ4108148.1 phage tail protein [Brevundimonas sp.]